VRRLTIAVLMSLAGSVHVARAVDTTPKPVPVHVITFAMNEETGVVEPTAWRRDRWPDFKCETEEALRAAAEEPEELRVRASTGKIAVRAFDAHHTLIYRGISRVVIWANVETKPERVKRPVFGVIVPEATKLFKLEGWMPATAGTFDVDQIAARFAEAGDARKELR
jgi:hypothetical protein